MELPTQRITRGVVNESALGEIAFDLKLPGAVLYDLGAVLNGEAEFLDETPSYHYLTLKLLERSIVLPLLRHYWPLEEAARAVADYFYLHPDADCHSRWSGVAEYLQQAAQAQMNTSPDICPSSGQIIASVLGAGVKKTLRELISQANLALMLAGPIDRCRVFSSKNRGSILETGGGSVREKDMETAGDIPYVRDLRFTAEELELKLAIGDTWTKLMVSEMESPRPIAIFIDSSGSMRECTFHRSLDISFEQMALILGGMIASSAEKANVDGQVFTFSRKLTGHWKTFRGFLQYIMNGGAARGGGGTSITSSILESGPLLAPDSAIFLISDCLDSVPYREAVRLEGLVREKNLRIFILFLQNSLVGAQKEQRAILNLGERHCTLSGASEIDSLVPLLDEFFSEVERSDVYLSGGN